MKNTVILALLAVVLCSAGAVAAPGDAAAELADVISFADVNRVIGKVHRELNEDIPLLSGETVRAIAARGFSFDWEAIKQAAAAKLFGELAANAHLLGKLLFLAVLCALLQNLQNSFEQPAIALLAYSVCYIFLAVIALTVFYNAMTLARDTVGNMGGFMQALLPLLISLLAGVGAVTTAALFTPLMLFVVSTVSVVVRDVVLPLIFLAAVLQCVNHLSEKYKVGNLCALFRQVGMTVLGLTMVIFVGIVTVQGVAGGVADGVALRTAKYAAGTFIPVVGKMFADTVDMVMGASLIIKNAVGLFGIATVATLCVLPLIKVASLILVIKLAGALVQPMGDAKMAKCLDEMGDNLVLVFGGVLAVAVMFFLTITMIIGAGSMTMMLR